MAAALEMARVVVPEARVAVETAAVKAEVTGLEEAVMEEGVALMATVEVAKERVGVGMVAVAFAAAALKGMEAG